MMPSHGNITLHGSSRMVNITGLEEDSTVTIRITASNAGGSTLRTFVNPRITTSTSEHRILLVVQFHVSIQYL